jgi:rubredoxin
VERIPVAGRCPECGASALRRYAAFMAAGPRMVTKCQTCFYVLRADLPEPSDLHPPFWPMTRLWRSTRAG